MMNSKFLAGKTYHFDCQVSVEWQWCCSLFMIRALDFFDEKKFWPLVWGSGLTVLATCPFGDMSRFPAKIIVFFFTFSLPAKSSAQSILHFIFASCLSLKKTYLVKWATMKVLVMMKICHLKARKSSNSLPPNHATSIAVMAIFEATTIQLKVSLLD